MAWYYANGGNRMGPVTPQAFEGLLRDQVVRGDTLVWYEGMPEWQAWEKIAATTATCAASGGRYLQRDMIPYEGKFISAEHKEAYFQRVREGVAQPNQLVYAGFWIRFGAKLIDGVINWVISLVVNLGLAAVFFGSFMMVQQPPNMEDPESVGIFLAYQGASLLAGILTGLLYQWYFLRRYAATPGKMAVKLKVVRADGSALSNGRIVGRYFAEMLSGLILGIGYIMAAFDEERRTLHDRICDTRVIVSR